MPTGRDDPAVVMIVGCGRSGTTLAYELLAAHPETAWISTWTDRTGITALAALNGLFRRGDLPRRRFLRPRPSEGYRTWDRALPPSPSRDGTIGAEEASAREREAIRRFARRHCRATGSGVFVNKNTRNSRRIAMLQRVFPQAGFVHVHRNPLDTISSLLRVEWWPGLPLWFRDGSSPRQLCETPSEQAALAAELYVREVEAIEHGRSLVPPERWTELDYQELVSDPPAGLERLLATAGLQPTAPLLERLGTIRGSSVGIHARTLTAEQRSAAKAVLDSR